MAILRVGTLQFNPEFLNPEKNYETIYNFLKNVEADIVVLPELAFTGYNFSNKRELMQIAENPFTSSGLSQLIRLAKEKDMALVVGYAEKEELRVYNSALFLADGSIQAIYRKTHLFHREKEFFTPGNTGFQSIEYNQIQFSMMICFDWFFPEVTRLMALEGIQIVCHPSNLVLNYCQDVMVSRSIENMITIVTANRIGTEKGKTETLTFTGQSQIVMPRGKIIYRGSSDKEELKVFKVDPATSNNKLITPENHMIKDRRPEYYKKVSKIRVK